MSATPAFGAGRPGSAWQRRLLLSVDATGYGRRHDRAQLSLQSRLLTVLDHAAAHASLDRDRWERQPAGDGELAVLPADASEIAVIDDFTARLAQALRDENEDFRADRRLRLRLALHQGLVSPASNGWAGQGIVAVSRTVDSVPVRLALQQSEADLVVALSRSLYTDVVRQFLTARHPEDFREVRVESKEFVDTAWLWISDGRVHELALHEPGAGESPAGPRPVTPRPPGRDSASAGAGPSVTFNGQTNIYDSSIGSIDTRPGRGRT